MLDMGFVHDVRRIVATLPTARQTLFFSATIAGPIETLARTMLANPARVSIEPTVTTAERVDQSVVFVDKADKRAMLERLLREPGESGDVGRTLVFTRTKHGANRLSEQLDRAGIGSAAIHGNKTPGSARARPRGVPSGDHASPRRDGRRGARHRRRGHLPRRQLRPAERGRELRPPHRPHGPRGSQRARHLVLRSRRALPARRHRAPDPASPAGYGRRPSARPGGGGSRRCASGDRAQQRRPAARRRLGATAHSVRAAPASGSTPFRESR